ncbi:aminotransferase class IV [Lysobacter sp. BMK333-48F3]|uniref:aminotransferase class IV n=1 Tax=Lysobacter sp. BMK333-48F3 TaxID=2867962 RepID=UPI001C8C0199|nr:aminotransferase class IV [Lysobacter sp. BMK333-48F3]MBX9403206.1 aminotransferase class IV [Lysobacter sp. BMK333-48F3]
MRVWCNGAMRQGAAIEPGDRGFTLGDGLFETLRWSGGEARHLQRHLARLRAGAAFLDIPLPWSDAELGTAMAADHPLDQRRGGVNQLEHQQAGQQGADQAELQHQNHRQQGQQPGGDARRRRASPPGC